MVGFTPPSRNRDCQSNVSFITVGNIITNVATLQAASNFGVSESPRLLACAIESRVFGPKPKVLEWTTPISGMSHFF